MNQFVVILVCFTPILTDYVFGQEFIAGSFILTQNSLNEAPYRYAGVLRKVLDKVERKDPPSQSDEENCSAKYRIKPSGKNLNSDFFPQLIRGVFRVKVFTYSKKFTLLLNL